MPLSQFHQSWNHEFSHSQLQIEEKYCWDSNQYLVWIFQKNVSLKQKIKICLQLTKILIIELSYSQLQVEGKIEIAEIILCEFSKSFCCFKTLNKDFVQLTKYQIVELTFREFSIGFHFFEVELIVIVVHLH